MNVRFTSKELIDIFKIVTMTFYPRLINNTF